MDATCTLRAEHQLILQVLSALEPALHRARESSRVSRAEFEPFLQFFRGFADHCHHGKEENRLFPCLQKCGMPGDCGPIAVMLEEHRQGRFHVRSMADCLTPADSGDAAAIDGFIHHGFAFLALLRGHIEKENHVLFQIADDMIQGDELSKLVDGYRHVEQDREYVQTYEQSQAVAKQLLSRLI